MKTVISVEYGKHYAEAYCGFSKMDYSLSSAGISFFNREEAGVIVPSHTFIVVDQNTVIEATDVGVVLSPISKFIDNRRYTVFFKKPIGLTDERAKVIIERAKSHLGRNYDWILSLYFVERWVRWRLGINEENTKIPSVFNSERAWVCSEHSADAYLAVPEYAELPPLSTRHTSKIGPYNLFVSPIFKSWRFDE